MKDIFTIILLIWTVWISWKYYQKPREIETVRYEEIVRRMPVTDAQSDKEIQAAVDIIFSPLDSNSPYRISDLTRLAATAATDAKANLITQQEGVLVERLCSLLLAANTEREKYQAEYRGIVNHNYDASKAADRDAKRQFFMEAHLQRWDSYVQQARRALLSDLYVLRKVQRQREIDNASVTKTNAQ